MCIRDRAETIRDMGFQPDQVQDFYPTPSTASTVMYYTGIDPRNMQPVRSVTSPKEKAMQRALLQYRRPENYNLVRQALIQAGREDLIGYGEKCLIRPGNAAHRGGSRKRNGNTRNEKTNKKTERSRSGGRTKKH